VSAAAKANTDIMSGVSAAILVHEKASGAMFLKISPETKMRRILKYSVLNMLIHYSFI
jgi:hypothetical protein